MSGDLQLLPTLKQYFGFDSFRPLQQEIVIDLMNRRDVLALLPTGGGKSLCYQLPALLMQGLTIVVSPLISLMKDQVQALEACGISATFLNSSIDSEESKRRFRGLHQGNYKLLYVAPERLMLPNFLATLKNWNPVLIAIDESHCISEWGHDFRPEYRKLAELREFFPEVPVIALTATATPRVQKDIVHLLRLQSPGIYMASFNRPNLSYTVLPKSDPENQVTDFLRSHQNGTGIIYCQSRKRTEALSERLTGKGFRAVPYHAGLTPKERSHHQDLFLEGQIQIVCATIAFGMGINKSDVRFVIHYDLPRNLEGYYQETGRAGRDGEASQCLLLFSTADATKLRRFIDDKQEEHERRIANEQLQQMIHYAESSGCRRKAMLNYFGESFDVGNCENCDNCLSPRETYDGTIAAQKFLSCVYRIRAKSGFSVGMKYVVEVLTGADTEKIRRWDHQELSTYGIGKEHTRAEWSSIGRELLRLGLVSQMSGEFSVLQLTQEGMGVLTERKPVALTARPAAKKEKARIERPTSRVDSNLFECLRRLRKRLAEERAVPAFVIFHDSVLQEIAQRSPLMLEEFARIKGVGKRRLQDFGPAFVAEIVNYRAQNNLT